MPDKKPITYEECQTHAAECRALAERASSPSDKIMLEHMAETWERVCADIKKELEQ
jgi:hypothetical protein